MSPDKVVSLALNVIPRLARMVTKVLEHGTSTPMTVSQFRILARLADGDEGVGTLAAGTGVRGPSMSQTVDGLVARGWVSRAEDPADRRRKRIGLTSAGRRALATAEQALAGELTRLLERLDPSEREAAAAALAGLGRALDEGWARLLAGLPGGPAHAPPRPGGSSPAVRRPR